MKIWFFIVALTVFCFASTRIVLLASYDSISSDKIALRSTVCPMIEPVFRIRPAIVLFGDSITQQAFGMDGKIGWASLLAAKYSRRADVLNRGFSGYNTQWAVNRLLSRVFTGSIAAADPRVDGPSNTGQALLCTVFFGANDAALPGGKQHVPLETFQQNLVRIVEHIHSTLGNSTPIVLLTPPPFDALAWMNKMNLSSPGR